MDAMENGRYGQLPAGSQSQMSANGACRQGSRSGGLCTGDIGLMHLRLGRTHA